LLTARGIGCPCRTISIKLAIITQDAFMTAIYKEGRSSENEYLHCKLMTGEGERGMYVILEWFNLRFTFERG
jgi:hypothetical protein